MLNTLLYNWKEARLSLLVLEGFQTHAESKINHSIMNPTKFSEKIKAIYNHPFTFPTLAKLSIHYRPSQIAEQLGVTEQAIYYHTDRMVNASLIYKDTSNGIKWKLTKKGLFILKQKATGSVNSLNNYQVARLIPTRLDNLSFIFRILSPIPDDPNLNWIEMKNRVSKCSLKYDTQHCGTS